MKFDLDILVTQPVPEIVKQIQLAEALGFADAARFVFLASEARWRNSAT